MNTDDADYRDDNTECPACDGSGYVTKGEAASIAELQAERDALQAERDALKRDICRFSHKIRWVGESDHPGCCLGCGRHRSLIREEALV